MMQFLEPTLGLLVVVFTVSNLAAMGLQVMNIEFMSTKTVNYA